MTKDDLMGIEDTAKQSIFTKTSALRNKSTIFTIGNRGDILNQQLESPILIPHSQLKNRVSSWINIISFCIIINIDNNFSTHTKHYFDRNNMLLSIMRVVNISL